MKINKLPLFLSVLISGSLLAKPVMELKPAEKTDSFVEQMQQSADPGLRDVVLESYINSLLKANSIGGPEDKNKIAYSVRSYREGQLVVTREEQKEQGKLRRNLKLDVYGIGHSLDSDCSRNEHRCWVLYPNSRDRWLEIAYAPKAIKELEKGMGLLIRELQR